MSLIILYNDEMASDQRCVLRLPYAFGQTYNTCKMRIAKDKTFAFATVGPTLTEKEQDILEAIIKQSFINAEGEYPIVELDHQDWFTIRLNLNILVMTKMASYYSFLRGSSEAKNEAYPAITQELDKHCILQFDTSYPAGGGTGLQVASMALLEGVKMKELMPIVADIEFTVSPEFDYVHRRTLKKMNYV